MKAVIKLTNAQLLALRDFFSGCEIKCPEVEEVSRQVNNRIEQLKTKEIANYIDNSEKELDSDWDI